MATPETSINTVPMLAALDKAASAVRTNAAATLAAAIIAKSSRPLSVGECLQVLRDIEYSLWTNNGHGVYEAWKKSFDPNKVY